MTVALRELPIPAGQRVLDVLPALRDVLDGTGPAVLPVPADDPRETERLASALRPGEPIDDGVAVVVATSGTTGIPKGALLSAAALRDSGTATHTFLGGSGGTSGRSAGSAAASEGRSAGSAAASEGRSAGSAAASEGRSAGSAPAWLLALPAHHIAGLQVLLRSVLVGTEPVVLDVSAGFDTADLVHGIEQMTGPRRYTSLVPTQLVKALDDPAATAALADLDAVLLGGAATPVPLRERAEAAGITLVRTYGMSETCGGCVYNGVPLDGVRVRISDDGRVLLGGDVLASGYRGLPDHPAFAEPGWFRTDDAGRLHDGVLTVLGRLDEAISTGGLTVVPQVVEAVLGTHPGVRECAIVGLADARLGERVVAAVVPNGSPPSLDELRKHVADQLGPTAAPRELHLLDALPLRGPGKVDRAALRATLAARSGA